MEGNSEAKVASPRSLIVGLTFIAAAWIAVFWQGLTTAIDIWLISEIFNHCLFVLPGALFLIYLKRAELDPAQVKPSYLLLVPCLGSLLLYAIGLAGDVQLFMHVATFTFLPLSIWAFIGHRLAYKIMFPLVFILFCIPIGEELIPALQEITTDLAMVMFDLSGIPVYRSGLYIEIPQGQFLVAEACSGISFFIVSIVIGSLYAYLNMQSAKRRIIFMLIAIFLPIIANAIRVFGIILTGYLTDMEHAVGADHLIYGWVFFAIVILCLLAIGELVREKKFKTEQVQKVTVSASPVSAKSKYLASVIIVGLMLVFFMWFKVINQQLNEPATDNNLSGLVVEDSDLSGDNYKSAWEPEFDQPYQEFQFSKKLNGTTTDVYVVWYPRGQGELISSMNRLYPEVLWTLESKSSHQLDDGQSMDLSVIVNPRGKRLLSYWYVVDGKVLTNKRMAKLYEIYRILMGNYIGSGLIAISQTTENVSESQDIASFAELTRSNLSDLNQYFAF